MNLRCVLCSILASIVVAMLIFGDAYSMPLRPLPLKIIPEIDLTVNADRIVNVRGPITPMASQDFAQDMAEKDNGKDTIYVVVNSPGGGILPGLEMIKRLEVTKSPVVCVVDGLAASMAALFIASCPVLVAHKYSIIMFHEYSTMIQGSRKDLRSQMQLAEAVWNAICRDTSKKMGMTEAEFRRRSAEDWWMNGYDATQIGFSRAVLNRFIVKNESENLFKQLTKFFTPEKEVE